jgi:8-oxo-dGTP diphosphatase
LAGVTDDFLGAFAVIRRADAILMVGNDRRIGGRIVRTWDLPGGRVEPRELLHEALAREVDEETGLLVRGAGEFLFVQEGERRQAGARSWAWRSFFFAVAVEPGEPRPGHEVRAVRWMTRPELERELDAPYHTSFLTWLREGGRLLRGDWVD